MLKSIAIGTLAALSLNVSAEGFQCLSEEQNLAVKVYGATASSHATREAQVMVISDFSVGQGRRTIARFTKEQNTLSNEGATYTGEVDLRFADIRRAGENIGGTKLGELAAVELAVDYSYDSKPLKHGEEVEGRLLLQKRDGSVIRIPMICARYLKN